MKLSTVVNKIIPLGQAISDYWERELPRWAPNYPLVNDADEDSRPPPPPEQKKLRELLESLPKDTIDKLLLVRSIGRRDYNPSKLEEECERLRDWYDNASEAIPDLAEDNTLGDDLADALVKLKKHKIDLDKLSSQLPRVWK
jgi:hypothetical protein